MPRGGRRGRFWQRFQGDGEDGMPPPPPPPPNTINMPPDLYRWSFPAPQQRRGGRTPRHNRNWVPAEGSPPPWGMSSGDHYMEIGSGTRRHSGEICFICGDLLANHPEVPTIHLCDNNEYAEVLDEPVYSVADEVEEDHSGVMSGQSGASPQHHPSPKHQGKSGVYHSGGRTGRHQRGNSPQAHHRRGARHQQQQQQQQQQQAAATETTDDQQYAVIDLTQRLTDAQQSLESMNHQITCLCGRIQATVNVTKVN